jgi:hypothetical protein
MCWGQGIPTITRRPSRAAASRKAADGTVYVRTVLNPVAAIAERSAVNRRASGNCAPVESGANVPYATPFTRKRRAPTSRNLPSTRTAVEVPERADEESVTEVITGPQQAQDS